MQAAIVRRRDRVDLIISRAAARAAVDARRRARLRKRRAFLGTARRRPASFAAPAEDARAIFFTAAPFEPWPTTRDFLAADRASIPRGILWLRAALAGSQANSRRWRRAMLHARHDVRGARDFC